MKIRGDNYIMSDNKKPVDTQRINEAIAAGRLDPDRVPDLMDDIRKLKPGEKRSFFESIYPPETIDQITATLKAGAQLPEEDRDLMQMMPLSIGQTLPQVLQDALTTTPIQAAIDNLQAAIDDTITIICQEAGIPVDQYHDYMLKLEKDREHNPGKYKKLDLNAGLPAGMPDIIEALRILKASQDIPSVNTKKPKEYLFPTDKVTMTTFQRAADILSGQNILAMEPRKSKRPIDTLVSIDFDQLKAVHITKQLTLFDREVHDTILTLAVVGGNEYITARMIYQTMRNSKEPPSQKALTEIYNSVIKLMCTHIIIDAASESKAYGFDTFRYDGMLIPAESATAKINGAIVDCIHLFRVPPLYDYANRKGQICRIDIKLLSNINISMTEETLILRGYLLRRISAIKKGAISNTILLDTIFDDLNITAPTDAARRKKKVDIRKKIHVLLNGFINNGFITKYTETKNGKEIRSITINY